MLRKDTDQMEIKFLQLFFSCMIGEATGNLSYYPSFSCQLGCRVALNLLKP